MRLFDTCAVVASDREQAERFQSLIDARIGASIYPRELDFVTLSDPEAGRVGSGGGTLRALHRLRDRGALGGRVLIIHAGGESRRMPAYAPEGKLFSPVPVGSSTLLPPVLLDLHLRLFLEYPWHDGEVIVASGDVVLDFDTESIPSDRGDVCGFAVPAGLEQGSRHGVFRLDRTRTRVIDYYQKMPPDYLAENARLPGTSDCALDIGLVSLAEAGVDRFLRLSDVSTPAGSLIEALENGEARFDLYLEFLTACLDGITRQEYAGRLAGRATLDPTTIEQFYELFADTSLHGIVTRRSTFLHFGSLADILESGEALSRSEIRPFYVHEEPEIACTVADRVVQAGCVECDFGASGRVYAEGCANLHVSLAEGDNLFIGVRDRGIEIPIPEGICLDQRDIREGAFVVIYSRSDTWRPGVAITDLVFCGEPFDEWLASRGLTAEGVLSDGTADLLDARLFYPGIETGQLAGYWDSSLVDDNWRTRFESAARRSLREITRAGDVVAREAARADIRARVLRKAVLLGHGWRSVSVQDFTKAFSSADLGPLRKMAGDTDDELLRLYRHRLLGSLDTEASQAASPEHQHIQIDYLSADDTEPLLTRGVKSDQIVWARAPVRLDLAGGWTDTPPYTLREGGRVVNVAADLNGQSPIQVFCRSTEELHVRIHSIDLGTTQTITQFAAIEDHDSPTAQFALPKAALALLGLTSEQSRGGTLESALQRLGCGIEITLLCAVPKGSGLGTSSILAAVVLAALHRFFGLVRGPDELYRMVLQVEQMMTTGGGWQDQIGGVAGGVKFIQSQPGMKPHPVVYQLDPYLFADRLMADHFTLVYTGITRLAKNILQEVVDRVNAKDPAYLFTLRYVGQLANLAQHVIALRDLPGLSRVITQSWESNKLIHPSTTNEEVEDLLACVDGLYTGVKLLGAGGGGYALFVSESPGQATTLKETLSGRFEGTTARLIDMSLNQSGLQVTVS